MTGSGDDRTMILTFDLSHPPEKVWRTLTDPELLAKWLLPVTGFNLEAGSEFAFSAPPQPDWDGSVNCRMLEVEEFKRLSWAWVAADIDTVLTFVLDRTETGTRLTIQQSGFEPGQKRALGGARYGWKMMGERLENLLAALP